jgi:hypothetical protein
MCNNLSYLSFSTQLSHLVVIASPNKGPQQSHEFLSISFGFLCPARLYVYSNLRSIQNIHQASKACPLQPKKCHLQNYRVKRHLVRDTTLDHQPKVPNYSKPIPTELILHMQVGSSMVPSQMNNPQPYVLEQLCLYMSRC